MTFSLNTTIIEPDQSNEINNAIILLHGYGGDGKDISSLAYQWRRSLKNTIFLCPDAHEKCQINPSGFQWFDLNTEDKDFILNESKYASSKILVTNENFGCGSSREHAVWALKDYGFSVIIAPSFADIFYSNCFKNGVLPIQVSRNVLQRIFTDISELEIDLENQTIRGDNIQENFEIQSDKKRRLLEGLDDIALTMQSENAIDVFEKKSDTPSIFK